MTRLLAPLMLTVALGAAQAQTLSPAPTPGLWENENRMTLNGQDIGAMMRKAQEDMLKSMPPEQRAQMAAMMKSQGNPFGGKKLACMTPEEVARGADVKSMLADMQKGAGNCQFEPVQVGGSTVSFKGRCQDPEGFTGDIAGEMKIESSKAVNFRFEGKGRMPAMARMPGMAGAGADGLVTMLMQGQSRWVAASCGNVKPTPR